MTQTCTRRTGWRWRACALLAAALFAGAASGAAAPVVVLNLDGAVSPATADYVVRGMQRAADGGASLIVLKMDTPGGLDTSMRQIIKAILSSTVPVATFVAPSGARAASAGTYILYASHIAAMSPATNLGAATPVAIGIGGSQPDEAGDKAKPEGKEKSTGKKDKSGKKEEAAPKGNLTQKQIHDAAAYIRGLAQLRGRNAEWAEKAVRDAVSLSAEEAQRLKVIDLIAHDVEDLLKKIDGRKLTVQGVERTLNTKDVTWVAIDPDWRSELLAVITNPSVALILMMI
ncbi:MAG: nodulation protein NfeD, partial [Betaproteobacteria bacterium]|nr:nodulation protein NfeD [Betaproteobacteria bacterium]